MSVEFPDHPFWDFSLAVYMTDGVAPACIEIQDRLNVDVNVIMFCLWTGATGRGVMTAAEIAALRRAVDTWHETVVKGLRAIRQRMKGGMPPAPLEFSDKLRRRIAKIEVDCEHLEQLMLVATVERPPVAGKDGETLAREAAANVVAYWKALGARPEPRDLKALATILAPACKSVPPARIEAITAAVTAA